ncbi:MAG TPA: hypothetical protein VIH76_09805 [Candidatus Acidoferrales bacterium]
MTPAAKVVYFIKLVTGLSTGGFFGYEMNAGHIESYYGMRPLLIPEVLSHFSYFQYCYADSADAEAALHTSASLLENMEKLSPDKSQERELAFTYTRLALLENAAGNADGPHELMTKALRWYASGVGREISASDMKTTLRIIDGYRQP